MKKRLIAMIMFCIVVLAGCSTSTDKDADNVSQKVYQDNSLEQPLQETLEATVAMKEDSPADTNEETSISELNAGQVLQDVQRDEGNVMQELEKLMATFGQAYFNGDIDTIEALLINGYEWDIEVYESPDQVDEIEIIQTKGLQQIDEQQLLDKYELSIEFRIPNEDSLTYLSVIWKNVEGIWKISGYGLEK